MKLEKLAEFDDRLFSFHREITEQATIFVKYDGYIKRQKEQVDRSKQLENARIPDDFDYRELPGLSNEVQEKLSTICPVSLGQASRIPGMTPAAIAIIQVYLKKGTAKRTEA